jgi:5-methylcytosine-specific restriction protein A
MSGGWKDSNRSAELTAEYRRLRPQILARDGHQCTWMTGGQRCTGPGQEVDHIVAGGSDHPSNLRSLCTQHHRRKSAREGAAARHQFSERRTPERHPGVIS